MRNKTELSKMLYDIVDSRQEKDKSPLTRGFLALKKNIDMLHRLREGEREAIDYWEEKLNLYGATREHLLEHAEFEFSHLIRLPQIVDKLTINDDMEGPPARNDNHAPR